MNSKLKSRHSLLSVTGKDQPGIIAKVTGILYDFGVNLEDISMTILEGEFAMMLIVEIPAKQNFAKFDEKIQAAAKSWKLHLHWRPLKRSLRRGQQHFETCTPYMLNVIGPDRTGIVYHISRLLAAHRINITDLNSRIIGKGQKAVYASNFEIDLPRKVSVPQMENKLRNLAKDLKVDLSLQPVQAIPF